MNDQPKVIDFGRLDKYDELRPQVKPVKTTYEEIKERRDQGKLIPGQYYQITDYVTTTTQAETQSAGHPFDILVRADSTTVLSEQAWAVRHEDDTYFQNARMEAWRLKYCLDNDTARFAWADATNGKGVIYWMQDEWDNQLPFDFKNIQFKRYKITATSKVVDGEEVLVALKDTYLGFRQLVQSGTGPLYPQDCTLSTSDTRWSFALSLNGTQDLTLQAGHHCTDNVVEACYLGAKQYLNNVTIQATSSTANSYNNHIDGTSHSISMGGSCYNNTLTQGSNCCTLSSSNDNTLSGSYYNTLSSSADNTLSDSVNNTLSDNSNYNTLSSSSSNTLSSDSNYNTLSCDSSNNTLSSSTGNTLSFCWLNILSNSDDNTLSGSDDNTLSNSRDNTLSSSGENTLSSNLFADLIGCYHAVLPEGSAYEQGIGGYMAEDGGLYIKNYGQRRTVQVFLAELGDEENPVIDGTITLEAGQLYRMPEAHFEPSANSQMTFTEEAEIHKYGFDWF